MFASQVTKAVDIEGVGTFVVRKLNRTRQNEALSEHSQKNLERFAAMAPHVQKMEAVKSDEFKASAEAASQAVEKDPFLAYDRTVLILHGVQTWPSGVSPSREQVVDLEPEVEERLAREIYELFRPKNAAEIKNS